MRLSGKIWMALFSVGVALAAVALTAIQSRGSSISVEPMPARLGTAQSHKESDDLAQFQWTMNCQGCHGPEGEGSPARDVPPLADIAAFQGVGGGREFLVRVPGVSRSPLNDHDLTSLLNWMVRTKTGNAGEQNFEKFTEEEVRDLRSQPLGSNIKEIRRNLVDQIN